MTDITFVRTNHFYESYQDFWRLVELSGFPTIYVNELDISKPGIYITSPMNEDWREHVNEEHKKGKLNNAHLILWNIERPSGSSGSVGEYGRQQRYLMGGLWSTGEKTKKRDNGEIVTSYGKFIDEVWVADRRLADDQALRFVVLGSDEGLGQPGDEKTYDFCHMSYMIPRRTRIYDHFTNIGPNSWGDERDQVLKRSRFALNIHQDIHWYQEPLRFALFAAYGLPIISESLYDSYPWSDEFMVTSIYDSLVGRMRQALTEDYAPYRDMGLRARERMCGEFRFRDMIIKAVKESTESWR